jgi:hypothetical protein
MAGRPLKLNDEITEIICSNIELGLSYSLSSAGAGITFETFNQWMKKGAEEGAEQIYVDFAIKIKKSEAICAKECVEYVRETARGGSLSAACWLLERRYKNDYVRQERIDMKAEHSGGIRIVLRQEDCGIDDE